jgi:methyltransferase-like protein/2-polyprenyl-3-methyl-5-hydroxy-6-metoxy-1,4-benzoquinol methylase
MNASAPSLYDDVQYPGHVHEHAHPRRLATLAKLYGMEPVPIEHCRVLELGCGVGANLIPIAYQYPQSEFVGIDLSGAAIERGSRNIEVLGLTNIRLLHRDILDIDASFGQFDYITAHGVYSWVPPPVRDHIMTVFKQNLSPNGVCYVSYNAHPYSHLRNLARDIMLYHTRNITDMKEKTGQARAILKFVSEGSKPKTLHNGILRDQYKRVSEMPEEVLFHDDLNEIATAFLLREVVGHASARELQYLSDADFSRRNLAPYSDEVREALQGFPATEFLARDQFHDFIDGIGFRRTLLCHADIPLQREIDADFVTRFHLLSGMEPVGEEFDLTDISPVQFKAKEGSNVITVSKPFLKAAYLCLGRAWPRALSFTELREQARLLLGANYELADGEEQSLVETMTVLALSGEVQFMVSPPLVTTTISERPKASLLARKQAETGTLLTNLLHHSVRLKDDRARHFLQLLDGTRTHEMIVAEMSRIISNTPGDFGTEPERAQHDTATDAVGDDTNRSLGVVSKLGLLIG